MNLTFMDRVLPIFAACFHLTLLLPSHHKRPQPYSEWDYFGEVAQLIETIDANPRIPVKNNLIGPSVASTEWGPDQVWATGYMEVYRDRMFAFCVERSVSLVYQSPGSERYLADTLITTALLRSTLDKELSSLKLFSPPTSTTKALSSSSLSTLHPQIEQLGTTSLS